MGRRIALLAVALGVLTIGVGPAPAAADCAPNDTVCHQLQDAKQTQANTYVYANDGHTVLSIRRGNEARIIVPS